MPLSALLTDCGKTSQFFTHLQSAKNSIVSAISEVEKMKSITSDATILNYATNLESFLRQKLLSIEATLSHFEVSCNVTRPSLATSTKTSSSWSSSISTVSQTKSMGSSTSQALGRLN